MPSTGGGVQGIAHITSTKENTPDTPRKMTIPPSSYEESDSGKLLEGISITSELGPMEFSRLQLL